MTFRDTYPGELRAADVGREVRLAGWVHRRRDHGGLIFIDLRDRTGMVQLVVDPSRAPEAHALAEQVRPEFVLTAHRRSGRPLARDRQPEPAHGRGRGQGRRARDPEPGQDAAVRDRDGGAVDVDETLRLKYRYLDLRRAPMLANLELRNAATQAARALPQRQPLHRGRDARSSPESTPEGARDFLVPSRLQPHQFYALPQSPQMFKQILMVAGMDRYYQIARCFRDEDLRADRQPEHTQIDIEMSFLSVPEIRELLEGLMTAIFEGVGETAPATPLPRLTYDEAMLRYGSDKPDLRYGFEIVELSETFAASEFKVFRGAVDGGGVVRAHPGARRRFPQPGPDRQAHRARQGARRQGHGLRVRARRAAPCAAPSSSSSPRPSRPRSWRRSAASPATSSSSPPTRRPSPPRCSAQLRLALIRLLAPEPSARWSLLWVEEFPLFEIDKETGTLTYGHNPFSLPTEATTPLMESDPLAVRGAQYDLVLNGVELGSGSLRNHDAAVQRAILRALGMSDERIDEALRLVPRGARVRRAAARRHRPRLRPHHHAARRRRLHPRRHRLPQDVVGRRPDDGRAGRR